MSQAGIPLALRGGLWVKRRGGQQPQRYGAHPGSSPNHTQVLPNKAQGRPKSQLGGSTTYLQSWFLHSDLPPHRPYFLGEAPWRTKGAACWGMRGEDPSLPLPGSRESQGKGRGQLTQRAGAGRLTLGYLTGQPLEARPPPALGGGGTRPRRRTDKVRSSPQGLG